MHKWLYIYLGLLCINAYFV